MKKKMNSLNSQQQTTTPAAPSATQYYITGMPPLTPAPAAAAVATSILKTNKATTASSIQQQQQQHQAIVNTIANNGKTSSCGNGLMTTNYMPVLLTNQTLISTVDPAKLTSTPTTSNLLAQNSNTNNSNIITSTNSNGNGKPVILSSGYQVLSSQQHNNLTPVIATPNGTVSVLLTSNQTLATAGHVAAPIIIRNTPPTTTTAATTTKSVQLKQHQQQLAARQQQQQQQQNKQQQQQKHHQQQQQKTKLHTLNPQSLSADILKQIVVGGNPVTGSTATLPPGATLLKPTIIQNKSIISQQQQQNPKKSVVKNTKMLITTTQPQQQQQQKLNNHTVITTTTTTSENSSQVFAALGMELVKASPTNVAQTVQKLPQVSLLQNPSKKSLKKSEIINDVSTTTSVMTVLKNSQEIKVANLSSEVSLIKKSNNSSSKETSLLKNSNKISDLDKSTITTTNAKTKNNNNNNNNNNKEQSIMKKDTNESYSLLKSNNDLKKSLEDEYNPNKPEKQTSLLKPINKSPQSSLGGNQTNATTPQLTSPRSQRSNSCTTNLKSSSSSSSNSASANNERRHSEPAKIELVKNIKNLEKSEESSQDIESLKSQELDIYFEDEEYLESSGDKLSINSEKSQDNDNNCPASAIEKEIKEIIEETKMKSNNKLKEDETLEFVTEMEEEKTKQVPQETESFETLMKEIKTNLEIEEKTKKVPQETDSFQTLMKEIQKTISSNENNNEVNENRNLTEDDGEEGKEDDDDDDDVTILPMEEMEIEQIEIDDDDDDDDVDGVNTENNNLRHSSPDNKEQFNESLLCDEQILISSSSSISNNSSDQNSISLIKSPKNDNISNVNATKTTTTTPLLKKTLMEPKVLTTKDESQINGYSSVLDMLSNFNMLNWRERIGTARGTNLKFQLNEFNLIQLYEKSTPNKRIHTAYEKPIYERESSHRRNENGEPPIYYMCRRCNVQGPAVDFLAPEFCSLSCLKRDCRKRRDDAGSLMRKRNRLNNSSNSNANKYYTNNSNNSNNCNSITSNINNDTNNINNPPPLSYIKKPKFRWTSYMNSNFSTMAAPISLFLNPFPTGPNNFMVGMKLEAIDPENCALFCVCTIIDIMGYRLKLSFDGYDSAYDFWLNADSMDIFPPGWCAKTNRILQPPKGISANKFNWGSYLNRERAVAAPRHLFTHLNSSSLVPRNPFKIGMHLEAEDLNDTGKLCVASVADVLDDRIRIHFDGWDDCYDIIVDINSPYIHPCGWHEGRQQLVVPPDCENTAFNWNDYIRKQGTGEAANEELFAPREPISFKPNMRLEVVDPRNPSLIRPATVVTHKGHRVKLHLDGWPSDYCFWLEDDSPDLHPIGWCDATGHDLEPPPGYQMTKQKMPCPVEGCRGIGNAKKAFMGVHATREGCPYAPENWRLVVEKPQRVEYENIVRTLPKQHKQIVTHPITASSLQAGLSEQQILERIQMLDNIKTRNVVVQQDKLPSNHSDLLCGLSSLAQIKKEEIKYSKIIPPNTTTTTSTSPTSSSADNVLDVNLDIAREFLYDYGPRLQQNYALWQNNFTFDVDKIKRNPLQWSTTEVSVFVDIYLKCRKTATKFSNEDIDGQAFLLLQQQDLTEKLGLKLGPAVKLYTCILQLRTLAVTKFEVPYKRIVNKK